MGLSNKPTSKPSSDSPPRIKPPYGVGSNEGPELTRQECWKKDPPVVGAKRNRTETEVCALNQKVAALDGPPLTQDAAIVRGLPSLKNVSLTMFCITFGYGVSQAFSTFSPRIIKTLDPTERAYGVLFIAAVLFSFHSSKLGLLWLTGTKPMSRARDWLSKESEGSKVGQCLRTALTWTAVAASTATISKLLLNAWRPIFNVIYEDPKIGGITAFVAFLATIPMVYIRWRCQSYNTKPADRKS